MRHRGAERIASRGPLMTDGGPMLSSTDWLNSSVIFDEQTQVARAWFFVLCSHASALMSPQKL